MREINLRLENMHCGACVRRVTQTLNRLGAQVNEVRVGAARVHASDGITDDAIVGALEKSGYTAFLEN